LAPRGEEESRTWVASNRESWAMAASRRQLLEMKCGHWEPEGLGRVEDRMPAAQNWLELRSRWGSRWWLGRGCTAAVAGLAELLVRHGVVDSERIGERFLRVVCAGRLRDEGEAAANSWASEVARGRMWSEDAGKGGSPEVDMGRRRSVAGSAGALEGEGHADSMRRRHRGVLLTASAANSLAGSSLEDTPPDMPVCCREMGSEQKCKESQSLGLASPEARSWTR
jgi:hypothetical protein